MKGIWTHGTSHQLRKFDIPTPGPGEVLIKNVAVASNPKDWKWPLIVPDEERIEGSDVAGHVEAVGERVTEFKKGDKVAALTWSPEAKPTWGAYAEYTIAPAITTFKFTSAPYEEMATMPLGMMTAFLGLFARIKLPTPPEDGSIAPPNGQVVIVGAAASSTGSFGVQLAKHAGYAVVGTAGRPAAVATEFGADKVIDYRDKDEAQMTAELKQAVDSLGGKLAGALDCASTLETNLVCAKVLAAYGGGKMSHVLPYGIEKDPSLLPPGVTTQNAYVFDVQSDFVELGQKWYKLVAEWIDQRKFRGNKVKVIPGGLDGVVEGLKLLEEDKAGGVKLVYRINETRS